MLGGSSGRNEPRAAFLTQGTEYAYASNQRIETQRSTHSKRLFAPKPGGHLEPERCLNGRDTSEKFMSIPLNKIEPTPLSASGLASASSRDQSRQDFERFLEYAEALLEPDPSPNLRAWTDLAEAWRISQVLGECNGNRSAAARKLGIGRRTLYAKMDKLGITSSWNF